MSPPEIAALNRASKPSALSPDGAIKTMRQRLGGEVSVMMAFPDVTPMQGDDGWNAA
jgi:hypothetical protein